MNTETEIILINEFLYSIAPDDPNFLFVMRNPPPGLNYTFDYNVVVDLSLIYRKGGIKGLFTTAKLMFRGMWDRDYFHQADRQSL